MQPSPASSRASIALLCYLDGSDDGMNLMGSPGLRKSTLLNSGFWGKVWNWRVWLATRLQWAKVADYDLDDDVYHGHNRNGEIVHAEVYTEGFRCR